MSKSDLTFSHSAGHRVFSCPGKSFLVGEYAVLAGLPAAVYPVGGKFELRPSTSEELDRNGFLAFPKGSPADLLMGERKLAYTYLDPVSGRGGIGASTAQFLLTFQALSLSAGIEESDSWIPLWKRYRELSSQRQLPSGADLVCQWAGTPILFDPTAQEVSDLSALEKVRGHLIFFLTQGRKVNTHIHLAHLAHLDRFSDLLGPVLGDAIGCLKDQNLKALGQALTQYAMALDRLGLEHPEAKSDRQEFLKLDGVAGAKGTGAMLSDVFVVLLSEGADFQTRKAVLNLGFSKGWILL